MGVSRSWVYEDHNYVMTARSEEDSVWKEWKKHGTFQEVEELEVVRSLGLKGTYVDVGSNVGNHSVYFASQCKCEHLVAVEPVSAFIDPFKRNMAVNAPNFDYKLIRAALLDKEGHGSMQSSDVHEAENSWAVIDDTGVLPIRTLDSLGIVGATLLKIDVEGSEADVIRGGSEFLRQNHPAIVVELVVDKKYDEFERLVAPFNYMCDHVNLYKNGAPTYLWQ